VEIGALHFVTLTGLAAATRLFEKRLG